MLVLEGRAYFPDVADKVAFDTFYHELLYCFTLHSLTHLLGMTRFAVFHAERSDVYGGSLRVFAQRIDGGHQTRAGIGEEIRDAEVAAGVTRYETYAAFAGRVEGVQYPLRQTVGDLSSKGSSITGYGAPSTGTTLLSYCGLGRDVIAYIVDDNPLKQGLVAPAPGPMCQSPLPPP